MLPDKIHFGVIVKGHVAEMHEMPFPEVGPTDIVVKLVANNICTTDYQQWLGLRDHQGFPMASGHECAGNIVAMGDEVYDNFKIGMQVATMHPFCGMCDSCRQGHTGDCQNVPHGGPGPDGYYGGFKRFADYVVMDQKLIVPINNDIPAAEAGFLEPVSTVVQGIHKVGVKPMQDVVVIGGGTMGLVNAQVAKAFGARVIVSDISQKKIKPQKGKKVLENKKLAKPSQLKNRNKIKTVVFKGKVRPKSCQQWFEDCKNITKISNIKNLDTSQCTNTANMFWGCRKLKSLDVSRFNGYECYVLQMQIIEKIRCKQI